MKKSTFEKRTANVNKNSNGYKYVLDLLSGQDKVYTCHTSGYRRFTTNIDRTDDAVRILSLAGLKKGEDFIVSNDSLRGGKTGNYIKLTSAGKRKRFNESPASVYHAVSTEKRFTREDGHYEIYTIEKTLTSRKGILNWIANNCRWECEVMTNKQYENAMDCMIF